MGKIAELLGLSDEDVEKLEQASAEADGWADIPDRTWTLAEVVKAEPRTSKAGRVCVSMQYKVVGLPGSLPEARYGSPHVWDNGAILNVPEFPDMTGQPEEAISKHRKNVGRFIHRCKAHGLDPDACIVDEPSALPVGDLPGTRLLLRVRTAPAGSTYEGRDGAMQTRTRTKYEVADVSAATPEALAKHGIEEPTPF